MQLISHCSGIYQRQAKTPLCAGCRFCLGELREDDTVSCREGTVCHSQHLGVSAPGQGALHTSARIAHPSQWGP